MNSGEQYVCLKSNILQVTTRRVNNVNLPVTARVCQPASQPDDGRTGRPTDKLVLLQFLLLTFLTYFLEPPDSQQMMKMRREPVLDGIVFYA